MPQITLVKKIKSDGSPCRKCSDIESRLVRDGHLKHIDRVIIAEEADPSSEGMQLAQQFGVTQAPFFLVTRPDGDVSVYTVYLKLVKEVFQSTVNQVDSNMELLDQHPDLDFI